MHFIYKRGDDRNNDFINDFDNNSGKVLSSFACSHSFNPHNGAMRHILFSLHLMETQIWK